MPNPLDTSSLVRPARTSGGCPTCGLLGCDCDEIAASFESLCPKCDSDPCECPGSPRMHSKTAGDVCVVCHRSRALCICASHAPVKQLHEGVSPSSERIKGQRPYPAAYLEILVNEGLTHYYNRDADGLRRWLERVLP